VHTDVVCLYFILTTKYEEVVAILWNPAGGRVILVKCLGVSSFRYDTSYLKFRL
jgi:hypothetical protein